MSQSFKVFQLSDGLWKNISTINLSE